MNTFSETMAASQGFQLTEANNGTGKYDIKLFLLLWLPLIETRFKGSAKYSDLKIVCGSKQWDVHRVVVASGSKFFEKACDGGFKVSSTPKPLTWLTPEL